MKRILFAALVITALQTNLSAAEKHRHGDASENSECPTKRARLADTINTEEIRRLEKQIATIKKETSDALLAVTAAQSQSTVGKMFYMLARRVGGWLSYNRAALPVEHDGVGGIALLDTPIKQMSLLKQPNGWECGYYSVFHYLATKNQCPISTLAERYKEFIATIKTSPLADAYALKTYTSRTQLNELTTTLGDPTEILIIEEQEISGTIPVVSDIIEQINILRARGKTFWALVCMKHPKHWVCLMFPPDGGCIGIDSLSLDLNDVPILVNVKNLCLGITSLPRTIQFQKTYKAYRKYAQQAPSAEKEALFTKIYANALENGFTAQTFDDLALHINRSVAARNSPSML